MSLNPDGRNYPFRVWTKENGLRNTRQLFTEIRSQEFHTKIQIVVVIEVWRDVCGVSIFTFNSLG